MVEETLVQKKEVQNVLVVKMVKKKQKHKWDETLVISVLVVAALSVLIILASYITVTGNAYTSIPTQESVEGMLNDAFTIEGNGRVKCANECSKASSVCIAAHKGEELIKCGQLIRNQDYECLCAKTS